MWFRSGSGANAGSHTAINNATATTSDPNHHARSIGRDANVISDFDWSRMPFIRCRTLHPWSVHCSGTYDSDQRFVATICRITDAYSKSVRHMQFQFPSEREARKFAKAYSPPKLVSATCCLLCEAETAERTSASISIRTEQRLLQTPQTPVRHCRNCGLAVCEKCSRRWGLNMVPKTYVFSSSNYPASLTVRVCKSCDWLSNAFCMALLQGRVSDALKLHETVR
jgi:hypothetical protein